MSISLKNMVNQQGDSINSPDFTLREEHFENDGSNEIYFKEEIEKKYYGDPLEIFHIFSTKEDPVENSDTLQLVNNQNVRIYVKQEYDETDMDNLLEKFNSLYLLDPTLEGGEENVEEEFVDLANVKVEPGLVTGQQEELCKIEPTDLCKRVVKVESGGTNVSSCYSPIVYPVKTKAEYPKVNSGIGNDYCRKELVQQLSRSSGNEVEEEESIANQQSMITCPESSEEVASDNAGEQTNLAGVSAYNNSSEESEYQNEKGIWLQSGLSTTLSSFISSMHYCNQADCMNQPNSVQEKDCFNSTCTYLEPNVENVISSNQDEHENLQSSDNENLNLTNTCLEKFNSHPNSCVNSNSSVSKHIPPYCLRSQRILPYNLRKRRKNISYDESIITSEQFYIESPKKQNFLVNRKLPSIQKTHFISEINSQNDSASSKSNTGRSNGNLERKEVSYKPDIGVFFKMNCKVVLEKLSLKDTATCKSSESSIDSNVSAMKVSSQLCENPFLNSKSSNIYYQEKGSCFDELNIPSQAVLSNQNKGGSSHTISHESNYMKSKAYLHKSENKIQSCETSSKLNKEFLKMNCKVTLEKLSIKHFLYNKSKPCGRPHKNTSHPGNNTLISSKITNSELSADSELRFSATAPTYSLPDNLFFDNNVTMGSDNTVDLGSNEICVSHKNVDNLCGGVRSCTAVPCLAYWYNKFCFGKCSSPKNTISTTNHSAPSTVQVCSSVQSTLLKRKFINLFKVISNQKFSKHKIGIITTVIFQSSLVISLIECKLLHINRTCCYNAFEGKRFPIRYLVHMSKALNNVSQVFSNSDDLKFMNNSNLCKHHCVKNFCNNIFVNYNVKNFQEPCGHVINPNSLSSKTHLRHNQIFQEQIFDYSPQTNHPIHFDVKSDAVHQTSSLLHSKLKCDICARSNYIKEFQCYPSTSKVCPILSKRNDNIQIPLTFCNNLPYPLRNRMHSTDKSYVGFYYKCIQPEFYDRKNCRIPSIKKQCSKQRKVKRKIVCLLKDKKIGKGNHAKKPTKENVLSNSNLSVISKQKIKLRLNRKSKFNKLQRWSKYILKQIKGQNISIKKSSLKKRVPSRSNKKVQSNMNGKVKRSNMKTSKRACNASNNINCSTEVLFKRKYNTSQRKSVRSRRIKFKTVASTLVTSQQNPYLKDFVPNQNETFSNLDITHDKNTTKISSYFKSNRVANSSKEESSKYTQLQESKFYNNCVRIHQNQCENCLIEDVSQKKKSVKDMLSWFTDPSEILEVKQISCTPRRYSKQKSLFQNSSILPSSTSEHQNLCNFITEPNVNRIMKTMSSENIFYIQNSLKKNKSKLLNSEMHQALFSPKRVISQEMSTKFHSNVEHASCSPIINVLLHFFNNNTPSVDQIEANSYLVLGLQDNPEIRIPVCLTEKKNCKLVYNYLKGSNTIQNLNRFPPFREYCIYSTTYLTNLLMRLLYNTLNVEIFTQRNILGNHSNLSSHDRYFRSISSSNTNAVNITNCTSSFNSTSPTVEAIFKEIRNVRNERFLNCKLLCNKLNSIEFNDSSNAKSNSSDSSSVSLEKIIFLQSPHFLNLFRSHVVPFNLNKQSYFHMNHVKSLPKNKINRSKSKNEHKMSSSVSQINICRRPSTFFEVIPFKRFKPNSYLESKIRTDISGNCVKWQRNKSEVSKDKLAVEPETDQLGKWKNMFNVPEKLQNLPISSERNISSKLKNQHNVNSPVTQICRNKRQRFFEMPIKRCKQYPDMDNTTRTDNSCNKKSQKCVQESVKDTASLKVLSELNCLGKWRTILNIPERLPHLSPNTFHGVKQKQRNVFQSLPVKKKTTSLSSSIQSKCTFNGTNSKNFSITTSVRRMSFQCNFCNSTFGKIKELTVHKLSHINDKPVVCQDCGDIEVNRKIYRCDQCFKIFYECNTLRIHKKLHEEVLVV